MAVNYPDWSAGAFARGDLVRFNGVLYEALNARTATDTDNPSVDTANWKVAAVLRIQDYNSLIEAIRLEINTTDSMINNSIPMFIQLAEESLQTRVRAPVQRARVILTVDAESRVEVPTDLLQVINMRYNVDDNINSTNSIQARGGTEILAGNYEEFRDLQRHYNLSSGFGLNSDRTSNYEAPVYWFDDRYFHIAPDVAMGTEIELYYYAMIPQLGTTVNLVNQNGDPINSAGQTTAQWVAAGNSANDFVQATDTVENNWFLTAKPDMLLYGAVMSAESYLRDDPRMDIWRRKFEQAELEIHHLVDRFEQGRTHTQQLYNAYSV